jgi:putative transposase
VFVTKYRRPVFTDAMLTYCEHTMRAACADLDAELVEFNGETDPVHPLVAYPPTLAISTLVQRHKGTGACVRSHMRGHLWAPSYFADSRRRIAVDHQAIHRETSPTT